MFADLHLHTTFSDGTCSPEEVVREASRHRLATVALTDHDTVEGCPRMAVACQAAGIEFIPGTELTAEAGGRELHILGYYLDTRDPGLLAAVARFQEVRTSRIREMVARLNALGIALPVESVFAIANCKSPGRPHLARALVQGGFCASFDEAFERFLKQGRPAWVPKFKFPAAEAIALIHRAKGAAVLAHPALNHCDDLIPALVAAGLDGLECFHTKHTPAATGRYQQLARQHKLLITGGSDCHGLNKGKPLIGSVKLPYAFVEELKVQAARRALEAGPMLADAQV